MLAAAGSGTPPDGPHRGARAPAAIVSTPAGHRGVGPRDEGMGREGDRMGIFRDDLFPDTVALITGGGTGIGRGIAEALAAHGARTAILSRKQEHLAPAAEAIAAGSGRPCLPLVADVRQPAQVEAAV